MLHRAAALVAAGGLLAAGTTQRVANAQGVKSPTTTPPPPPPPPSSSSSSSSNPPRQYRYARAIGLGSVLGFATGYALKKVARAFILVVGLQFVFLQTLVALDYVAIKWDNVMARSEPALSAEGQRRNEARLVTLLTTNLPFKASFLASVYGGWKLA